MEPGEKCISQEGTWYNAFGDISHQIKTGERLTVTGYIYISGTRFYSFEETPKGNFYLALAFKPLRNLN